jgi:hypothetical protein
LVVTLSALLAATRALSAALLTAALIGLIRHTDPPDKCSGDIAGYRLSAMRGPVFQSRNLDS